MLLRAKAILLLLLILIPQIHPVYAKDLSTCLRDRLRALLNEHVTLQSPPSLSLETVPYSGDPDFLLVVPNKYSRNEINRIAAGVERLAGKLNPNGMKSLTPKILIPKDAPTTKRLLTDNNSGGFFDSETNTIVLNPDLDSNMGLLHEVRHLYQKLRGSRLRQNSIENPNLPKPYERGVNLDEIDAYTLSVTNSAGLVRKKLNQNGIDALSFFANALKDISGAYKDHVLEILSRKRTAGIVSISSYKGDFIMTIEVAGSDGHKSRLYFKVPDTEPTFRQALQKTGLLNEKGEKRPNRNVWPSQEFQNMHLENTPGFQKFLNTQLEQISRIQNLSQQIEIEVSQIKLTWLGRLSAQKKLDRIGVLVRELNRARREFEEQNFGYHF